MKRFISIIALFLTALTVGAQTRTYTDNASRTFIIGLDSYFFGESGSLDFRIGSNSWQAVVDGERVSVGNAILDDGNGEVVVGIHDFTGDRNPELVVARRTDAALIASVYSLSGGAWTKIGRIGVGGGGAQDIRVFRQVISIRDHNSDTLHSWTYHARGFDYKGSDGGQDPTPAE